MRADGVESESGVDSTELEGSFAARRRVRGCVRAVRTGEGEEEGVAGTAIDASPTVGDVGTLAGIEDRDSRGAFSRGRCIEA